MCRSEEAAKRDTMSLSADSFGEPVPGTASANRLGARPPRPDSPWTGRNTPPPPCRQQCLFCGRQRHAQRRQCPAYNEQCTRCGKMHHFATVCMSKPSPAPAVRRDKLYHRPGAAISVVIAVTNAESAPTIDVTLESANGQAELSVLPDSGADISAAGPELLEALGTNVQNLLPTDVSPKVANGRPMKALGAIPGRIRLHERTVTTTIYIFKQVTGVLLLWKESRNLGILPASYLVPPVHAEASNQQVNATSTQVDVSAETLIAKFRWYLTVKSSACLVKAFA